MTKDEYETMKQIKKVEGDILAKTCENYSLKIQASIDALVAERDSIASSHYQMYQKAHDAIQEYENQLYIFQVNAEIEEMCR